MKPRYNTALLCAAAAGLLVSASAAAVMQTLPKRYAERPSAARRTSTGDSSRPGGLRPLGSSGTGAARLDNPRAGMDRMPEYNGTTDPDYRLVAGVLRADYIPGNMFYDEGMYAVPMRQEDKLVGLSGFVYPTGGGVEIDGLYYCMTYIDAQHSPSGEAVYARSCYDSSTWREIYYEDDADITRVANDLAYDPVTDQVYGCFSNQYGDGYVFGTIDVRGDWSVTVIDDLNRPFDALAAASDGTLYAIDFNGDLLTVDKQTGTCTPVGNTGLQPLYDSTGTIDPQTDRMFYALMGAKEGELFGGLYEIDIHTAQARLLKHFDRNEQLAGMYVPSPKAEAGVPGTPADLRFEFTDDALHGNVSFVAPAVNYGGLPLEGELHYEIAADGNLLAEGMVAAGAVAVVPVEFAEQGLYLLTVTLANSTGTGLPAHVTVTADNVAPDAMDTPVKARYSDGLVHLSWPAVDKGQENGYIDLDNLTYSVVRIPDLKTVAEGLTETGCTDELPGFNCTDNDYYTYTVYAHDGDLRCGSMESNKIWVRGEEVPYAKDIKKYKDQYDFTIIDANGDQGWVWSFSSWDMEHMEMPGSWWVDTDDWLVTKGLHLQRGLCYRHTVNLYGTGSASMPWPKVEIKCGAGNSVEDMTMELMAVTQIDHEDFRTYTSYITPQEDGIYFIGYHALTPQNGGTLVLDNIRVSEGMALATPEAVENLTAVYDADRHVTLSFTAPVLGLDGSELESIECVKIGRDGAQVAVMTDIEPGQQVVWTDNEVKAGLHTYSVTAANYMGDGKEALVEIYNGHKPPVAPAWASFAEIGHTGEVTVSWEAVTLDVDGGCLPDGSVTYEVRLAGSETALSEGLTGTQVNIQATDPEVQDLLMFDVYACTETGRSDKCARTDVTPVGRPYSLPFSESASGGSAHSLVATTSNDGFAAWGVGNDEMFSDVFSYEGDNGYFMMRSPYQNGSANLIFGKIDLTGAENPALTLMAFNLQGDGRDSNTLKVQAREPGHEWKSIKTVTMDEFDDFGWNRVIAPLSDFKGKTVQLQLVGMCDYYSTMFVDHIAVEEFAAVDLAVKSVDMPAVVDVDSELSVRVLVENIGSETLRAADWTVEMIVNGQLAATAQGREIASTQLGAVTLRQRIGRDTPEDMDVLVRIAAPGDANEADNVYDAKVSVDFAMVVAPSQLTGEYAADGTHLSWQAPDMGAAAPEVVSESFEDQAAWEYENLCPWTLCDADAKRIGGVMGVDLPNVPDCGEGAAGFFVIDSEYDFGQLGYLFGARTGRHMLGNFYNIDMEADDWLISPELYGGRQMLTFWVRCFHPAYAETCQVLVSDGGTDLDDFVPVLTREVVTNDWTLCRVALPAGTRRFAIRGMSRDGYMMLLDDIDYIPAGAPRLLHLTGYKVYRNGQEVASLRASETTWTDQAVDADAVYFVTAVYDEGESCASNLFGAQSGAAAAVADSVVVRAAEGAVIIEGAEGLGARVTRTDGVTVAAEVCGHMTRIAIQPGLYLVTVNNNTHKIIIK